MVAGSISSGEEHGINCWWDLIRLKQVFSVSVCHMQWLPDFLVIVIQYIYIYFFFFIIQRVKACAIPCPHQPPSRGDNTVLVAQGGTATPGATKQLLPPDRGGSTALSYRNCVITPGWRLMRTWYRMHFHTLYDEKNKNKNIYWITMTRK